MTLFFPHIVAPYFKGVILRVLTLIGESESSVGRLPKSTWFIVLDVILKVLAIGMALHMAFLPNESLTDLLREAILVQHELIFAIIFLSVLPPLFIPADQSWLL